jgi:succinate dehydrogenase / fumarate reductase membrane anchor subunit
MWIFTRISGLSLILLAAIGVISAFVLGARTQVDLPTLVRWTFFPNPNHVINSNIPDVTLGWANAFWQVMQILIVFFGVTHGFNGLRVVIEDFIGQSFARPFLRGFIFLLWLFSLVTALYVVIFS